MAVSDGINPGKLHIPYAFPAFPQPEADIELFDEQDYMVKSDHAAVPVTVVKAPTSERDQEIERIMDQGFTNYAGALAMTRHLA